MISTKQLSISIFLLLLFASCVNKQPFDLEKEKKQILKLHNAQRAHHFKKDSIAFLNQLYQHFISINKGIISHPKKEETLARYNGYFSVVEFVKWDDVTEPIIKFLDDGSMAYTIVDKIVTVTYKN